MSKVMLTCMDGMMRSLNFLLCRHIKLWPVKGEVRVASLLVAISYRADGEVETGSTELRIKLG